MEKLIAMKFRGLLYALPLVALSACSSAATAAELTVVSWGGSLQEAERKAWFEPVAEELGITVKEDTVNGIADVRAQVQSGAGTWDLVELGSNSCVKLAQEGALEALDYSVIDTDGLDPAYVNE